VSTLDLVSRFGPCKPQAADDWSSDAPLPTTVKTFYWEVGPMGEPGPRGPSGVTLPTPGGGGVWLPPLSRLRAAQDGYRYDGRTAARFEGWPDPWWVIGQLDGDALVFDSVSGHALLRFHGTGTWDEGVDLPGTLDDAVAALALIGTLTADAGDGAFTDDFGPDPTWLQITARTVIARYGETGRLALDFVTA